MSEPDADKNGSRGHILLVEDEHLVREVTQGMLEAAGYRVSPAEDGAGAMALLKQGPQAFQAAVVDFTLPDMNGEKTFEELRKICPALPVILVSGHDIGRIKEFFKDDSLLTFLKKPFLMRDLIAAMSDLIGRSAGGAP